MPTSNSVPAMLLLPLIREWVSLRDDPEYAVATLAEKTALVDRGRGVSLDLISKILAGNYDKALSFENADAIVCATGHGVLGWMRPELAPFYPETGLTCANPRCDNPIELIEGAFKRRFCSKNCVMMALRIRSGTAPPTNDATATWTCEFCTEEFQVPRRSGGTSRRACDKPECKRALKARLMRDYRRRHPEYLEEQRERRAQLQAA